MTESLQFGSIKPNDQTFTLRAIAQRQIKSLERRMEATGNYSFYREEIRKVIKHEQAIVRGGVTD